MKDGTIDHLSTEQPCDAPEGEIPLTACVRGLNYHKTFLGEDRLRYPMKRVGKRGEGKFTRISWAEAVDTIASEWIRIRDTYGVGSRYVNYATGISALNRGNNMAKRLLNLDGGFLDYYNSYSTACIRQATDIMYGTNQTGHDPEDWLNSNLIILWGHNPEETKFDSVTMNVLLRAKKKGIPIIVIDPRRNDTAVRLDAEWIPVRPATDSALMDAMAWVIVEEGLQDQEFLDRCCIGFDKAHMPEGVDPSECYLSYMYGEKDGVSKTPEWAEAYHRSTGRHHPQPGKALCPGKARGAHSGLRPAAQCQRGAEHPGRHSACLHDWKCGNFRRLGQRHSQTGWNIKTHPGQSWSNRYNRQIPVYLWTDAVLHGHTMNQLDGVQWIDGSEEPVTLESDIKMILNLAGNCLINQHGDINRTAEILRDESKCEFIVVSDLFMTASAKFADILLPGISMFECENITMPWQYGNFLGFNNKVIEPLYEGRFEYDWLSEVADRLGLKEQFTCGRTASEWLEYLYEELRKTETELPDYEIFKKQALFHYQKQPIRPAFKEECRDPETHPFPTKSGKIEIFSEKVYRTEFKEFMPAIPRYVPPVEGAQDPLAEKYPLQLTGWHTKRRCHSIHDNNQDMHRLDPQTLWMNPADAAARNLKDGDLAEVFNDRGRIRMPVRVTDRIMPGVTAISQGAWYRPDKNGTDTAGSINVLTSQHPTPYARGNGQHTNLVEVIRYGL